MVFSSLWNCCNCDSPLASLVTIPDINQSQPCMEQIVANKNGWFLEHFTVTFYRSTLWDDIYIYSKCRLLASLLSIGSKVAPLFFTDPFFLRLNERFQLWFSQNLWLELYIFTSHYGSMGRLHIYLSIYIVDFYGKIWIGKYNNRPMDPSWPCKKPEKKKQLFRWGRWRKIFEEFQLRWDSILAISTVVNCFLETQHWWGIRKMGTNKLGDS